MTAKGACKPCPGSRGVCVWHEALGLQATASSLHTWRSTKLTPHSCKARCQDARAWRKGGCWRCPRLQANTEGLQQVAWPLQRPHLGPGQLRLGLGSSLVLHASARCHAGSVSAV